MLMLKKKNNFVSIQPDIIMLIARRLTQIKKEKIDARKTKTGVGASFSPTLRLVVVAEKAFPPELIA